MMLVACFVSLFLALEFTMLHRVIDGELFPSLVFGWVLGWIVMLVVVAAKHY